MAVWVEAWGYDHPELMVGMYITTGDGTLTIHGLQTINPTASGGARWCGVASVHASVNGVSYGSLGFTGCTFGGYGRGANCTGPCTTYNYNISGCTGQCAPTSWTPNVNSSSAARQSWTTPQWTGGNTWSVSGIEGYQNIMISFTPNFGNSAFNLFGRFFFGIDIGYQGSKIRWWSNTSKSRLIKEEFVRRHHDGTPPLKHETDHTARRPFIGWDRSYRNVQVNDDRDIHALYTELPVWIMSGGVWVPYDPGNLNAIPHDHVWNENGYNLNYIHRFNGTSWTRDRTVHRVNSGAWGKIPV